MSQDIHKFVNNDVNNVSKTCEPSGGMFLRRIVDFVTFGHHAHSQIMARILSDREIKKLFGDVLIGADERFVSPNGIEIRLGKEIRFMSTNEKRSIPEGHFITVHPGESVLITSLEKLDFTRKTINKHFAGQMLMAIITPTTTMMREGMLQCATKVHAGYFGELNWGFRNSSSKDFTIQQGEPMFNLTLFLLEKDEVPDVAYGEKPEHTYQNTSGIASSRRKVHADIPKEQIVSSSFLKLDPKVQLREAGHPFTFIGTELTQLEGKFELVSSDVKALERKIDDVMAAVQLKSLTSTIAAIVMLMGLVLTVVTNDSTLKFLKNQGSWIGILLFLVAAVILFFALRRSKK